MNKKTKRKTQSVIQGLLSLVKRMDETVYEESEEVDMAEDYIEELNLGSGYSSYAKKYKRHGGVR